MIPRIIHYCWLSDDPVPPRLQAYMDTWRRILPGYEIRLWNFDRFPRGKSAWVDEAFDHRKYAFAADYIRAYALYHHGGIYLDSDVEVLKSFDDLLSLPYFMCRETGSRCVEAAVMGAEAGHPLYKALLERYDKRHFIRPDGSMDITPMPDVIGETAVALGRSLADVATPAEVSADPAVLFMLPSDFFSPINIENLELRSTSRTYCIHRFAGSWKSPWHRFKKNLQSLIGPRAAQAIINIKRHLHLDFI
ncbi:MAG: glycosyl transferase [Muribaculaceae bacterium]|nr:glycosyl transferase [Muribaculaceae bacterium]